MVEVARGNPVWAMGLMSGTSMDGIDAALILSDGETITAFGPSRFQPYDAGYRAQMREANRIVPALSTEVLRQPLAWPGALHALAEATVALHGEAVEALAGAAGFRPAVVGFHGQTVAHRPEAGLTLQLGDGAALGWRLGLPTVWDFRTADMGAGGQGAPLAPFYHHALAGQAGLAGPLAFLNLGGVGNLTWIGDVAGRPEAPGGLLAFDTGPANALIDDLVAARSGAGFDADGALARAGRVDADALAAMLPGAFLAAPPPKSLDRNDFQGALEAVAAMSLEDGAAVLTALTAECVARGLAHLPAPPARWLVTGGGRCNATMMAMLAERLAAPVVPVETAGFDGDMLEAQAFGFLALRVLRGLATSAPGTTGCRAPVSGGRIAWP